MLALNLLRKAAEAVSTFLLVTVIAALVWLYAEQKNVHDQVTPEFTVVFGDAKQREDFLILPESVRVKLNFRGSNNQFEVLKKILENGPCVVPIDPSKPSDTVSLSEKLQKTLFEDNRLTVSNLKIDQGKGSVEVTADKMVDTPFDLVKRYERLSLAAPPEWTQKIDQVSIRLPSRLAKIWKEGKNKVQAEVDLNNLNLASRPKTGEKIACAVPVSLPALDSYYALAAVGEAEKKLLREHVAFTPAALDVNLTPNADTSTLVLTRAVPITLSATPRLLEKWSFEITSESGSKFINDLRLIVSPDVRDRILQSEKSNNADPKLIWAVIRITGDPQKDTLTLTPEVIAPPGVTVAPSMLLPQITIRATPRSEK